MATLAIKKLVRPISDEEGFAVGVSRRTGQGDIYPTHQGFVSPKTPFTLPLLAGPSESLVDFLSLLCFYVCFYASGELFRKIFSICLIVVFYLPAFRLYFVFLV